MFGLPLNALTLVGCSLATAAMFCEVVFCALAIYYCIRQERESMKKYELLLVGSIVPGLIGVGMLCLGVAPDVNDWTAWLAPGITWLMALVFTVDLLSNRARPEPVV
jgi:hypothetical protein